MPLLCSIDGLNNSHELVICDSELSRQAHKELFRFSDDVYMVAGNGTDAFNAITGAVASCNAAPSVRPSKIHIVFCWENLLKISLWKPVKPTAVDVFTILKNTGLSSQDLQPFKNADVNDLFPWLYYAKRFDVLRKTCHTTKKQVESRLKDHTIRVDCHLIAEDTKRIVASSL